MLAQLRSLTRGWIAYILLFLLVIAFAIWGVNDVFSGVGSQNLAEVGGRKITPPMLARELELTLRAQRNQGNNLTQQEAIDAGYHERLLESMIGRAALQEYAQKINVSASNAQVAARIREIPAVLNPVTGAFDETAYDSFLAQLGYTRTEFERDIRGDMTMQMLMDSLVAGARAPSSYGALAVAYEGETRTISIAEAPAPSLASIPAPTEAQLQTFYEESEAQLRLPEFRALTLVYARANDFVGRVSVPEARIQEEYEARRAALTPPERRTYVRLTAQNEAQANDAVARLGRGESVDAVAQALGIQVLRGENQARAEVTDRQVADAVFSMAARAPARVVRGQLSPFVVVRVESITPAVEPTLASMRDELRAAIAHDEAAELLNTAIGAFEDARAGGTSVADAARAAGLPTVVVPAVEAGGRDQTGAPVAAVEGQEDILTTAFQTAEGESSDFMPVGDADVIVSVDRVIPESVRPFDEVRDELRQSWLRRERARRMREMGEAVVTAVNGGQAFAAAARANRFSVVVTSRPVDRRAASNIPARGLPSQIFATQPGGVSTDIRADGEAVLVAIVETINRIDISANPQAVEAGRQQIQQSLTSSYGEALQQDIVTSMNPRRNEGLLEQRFPNSNAANANAEETQ